jgi:phosphopentomutase
MMNRVILIVIDGFGIGAMPDAAAYGDEGANTLVHLAEQAGGLRLPTMEALGLGHITAIPGVQVMAQPEGCFGRLGFLSRDVDSLSGHWEMNGYVQAIAGHSYPNGFPQQLIAILEQVSGRKMLGNRVASSRSVLQDYGDEHLASGAPIVWTDGRRTCHLAAHETIMRPEALHQLCHKARKLLREPWGIMRVVAHPLTGAKGNIRFGDQRRDFVIEPVGTTMLDELNRAGQILTGVGKVGDLFNGRGLTRTLPQARWGTLFDEVKAMLKKVPRGLIYVGLNLLDSDDASWAGALHDFDRRLPSLLEQLRPGDLFVLTGDHGRDPGKPLQATTREYVPLLVSGPKLAHGVNLGIRSTAADLGQTIVEALRGESLAVGESFLDALRPG